MCPGVLQSPGGWQLTFSCSALEFLPSGQFLQRERARRGGGLRIIYPHPTYRASGQRVRPPTDWLLPGYPIRNRPGRGGNGAVGWVHLPPHPPPGSSKFGSLNSAKTAQVARQFSFGVCGSVNVRTVQLGRQMCLKTTQDDRVFFVGVFAVP